jgi:hypothetical protein
MKRAALILGLSLLAGCNRAQTNNCTAAADEKCLPKEYVAEWKEFYALDKKNSQPRLSKDEAIRRAGLLDDLNTQIPKPEPGFNWEWHADTLKWKKVPAPVQQGPAK